MTAFERKTTHSDDALAHRSPPYHIPSMSLILLPISEQITELETALWEIFDARFVSNATGRSLELLGDLVGEPDLDDGVTGYRLRISLKLRALVSRGLRKDFRELLALLVGTTWALSEEPGYVVVTQNDDTLVNTQALARLLGVASADGVLVRFTGNETAAEGMSWPSQDATIEGTPWPSWDGSEAGTPWPGVRNS